MRFLRQHYLNNKQLLPMLLFSSAPLCYATVHSTDLPRAFKRLLNLLSNTQGTKEGFKSLILLRDSATHRTESLEFCHESRQRKKQASASFHNTSSKKTLLPVHYNWNSFLSPSSSSTLRTHAAADEETKLDFFAPQTPS